MHLQKVIIHNFRSIKDATFDLQKYSLLIGENNSGKTNLITALRTFYEDGVKYNDKVDFPKYIKTDDFESWIELAFLTSNDEQNNLKVNYQSSDNVLRVRRIFKSNNNPELVKSAQSNIYAYEGGVLSSNLFYGAKNVSEAKLGNLIYIPETSKMEDTVKLTGPSPLREMINFVMKKVVKSSSSFSNLQSAFTEFNEQFKEESSKDGFSLDSLVEDINQNIKEWGIKFGVSINPVSPENIIKNLISHHLEDSALGGEKIDLNCYGQGLQRHLIYTLLRLNAKYVEKRIEKKKEWSPDFTLILFEEPEAFLHPTQQELLNFSLNELAQDVTQQMLISTHSPIFVSKNIDKLPSLVKLLRTNGKTDVHQITDDELDSLFDENNSLYRVFSSKLNDSQVDQPTKDLIRRKGLGSDSEDIQRKLEEESLKYFLWLDSERTSSFFAKHVLICEGASEKIFLDYLFDTVWGDLKGRHIYCLDAMGKFNIHRYMNLFSELGIFHSVLFDSDQDTAIHTIVNEFLNDNKNSYTINVYAFEKDIEHFLGIPTIQDKYKRPLNIMWHYKNDKIDNSKIEELREIILSLLQR